MWICDPAVSADGNTQSKVCMYKLTTTCCVTRLVNKLLKYKCVVKCWCFNNKSVVAVVDFLHCLLGERILYTSEERE